VYRRSYPRGHIRESFMTYYDRISNRTTYQYSTNKTEKKYVQWVYTYQESWELSLILIVTIQFTAVHLIEYKKE
jgi:hypothetical protein